MMNTSDTPVAPEHRLPVSTGMDVMNSEMFGALSWSERIVRQPRTSSEWTSYYEQNARALLEVPWNVGAELSPQEVAAVRSSLQAFQAGESSEGHHLLRYAKAYAARTGDKAYVPAIQLFIAEEQRHARDLGRFLKLNGISLVRTTFTDVVFRKLRHLFAGLEVSITVLVTAEIIAKVYYAALRDATASLILRCLCDQILRDELMHVQFQVQHLAVLRSHRSRLGMVVTMALQRFLFLGATSVVGIFHRRTLSEGSYDFRKWWHCCWAEFNTGFASSSYPAEAQTRIEVAETARATSP